ncbi:uncharacterized protein ColSpa_11195 [Colletotrichum spaethianum]|uniref:Uncharacterized protein n=1 Tax=Colletotrichum spaethianum TaxID=700344 RepID=A0AA37UKA8_9PEZI|nr:uncharacterized protein ColSpa_11195 [Colletotrichum spaethianum]GKT51014.1 hypothetical protein ColSpa_11195 [Colletotrichum spaethianum]
MPEIASMLSTGNAMEIMVDIIDVQTTPLGLDPRGMLQSGHLKLKGKLKTADPRIDPETPGYQFTTYRKELVIDFLNQNGEMVGLAILTKTIAAMESLCTI